MAAGVASPPAVVTSMVAQPFSAQEGLVQTDQAPAVPVETPLSLALLAWTRREFEPTLDITTAPTAVAAATTPTAASAATTFAATAAAPGTLDVTIEAESMKVTPAKAGSIFRDSSASGRKALLLSTNSTASQTLSLPASTSLVIRARGDQYNGAPNMTVSIDGNVVSTTQVSSKSWTDYSIPIDVPAGTHTVSIAFTNDYRKRNLRLDTITVVAGDVTPAPTPDHFQAADWLWKPIPSNPVLADNSATWVNYLAATDASRIANLYDYGVTLIPASAITSSAPRYDVTFTQPWGSDPFGSYTVPIPADTKVPPGSDGQIAVLDPTTGKAFGIWQAKYNSATNTWSGSWGGMTDLNGNGVDQSGSATATNLARYAGVVTAEEFSAAIAANTGIDHALFISSDIAGPGYASPATKSDGTNIAGVAVPIPEGYRIQLDPSIDVDAIPGITPGEKVIAKTLQTYGAYLGDQGSARMAFVFEAVPDATSSNPGAVWVDAGFAWDYYDMGNIPWSQLRVLASPDGTTTTAL